MTEKTHKRWSSSEDKYLRLALKEGKSAIAVAQYLGRNQTSIYARKMYLGLKGRFARGSKLDVQANRLVRTLKESPKIPISGDTYNIESGIAIPGRYTKYEEDRVRIRNTFNQLEAGQSFIIPGNLVYIARKMACTEFQSYKVRIVHTDQNKQFARVYRQR